MNKQGEPRGSLVKNDGGPAFPRRGSVHDGGMYYHDGSWQEGMSLRDWFAGQALAGILASYSNVINIADETVCAKEAYRRADAMLAARESDSIDKP